MRYLPCLCCVIAVIYNFETANSSCDDFLGNSTENVFSLNSSSLLDYLDFKAICFSSHIKIKMSRCALTDIGYVGSVALHDSSGIPYEDDMCRNQLGGDQILIIVRGNFSDCAFRMTETLSGMLYEFELKNINNYTGAAFSHLPRLKIHFSCKYDMDFDLSFKSQLLLDPDERVIDINSKSINSIPNEVFGSSFLLYNDSSFLYPLSSDVTLTIQVPDYVYFEVATEAGSTYVIQGQTCWATPTSDSDDPSTYDIVENGCAAKDVLFSDANVVFENYASTKFKVGFRSFSWSDGETGLYLHCKVDLCDTNQLATCYDDPCTSARLMKRQIAPRRLGHHMFSYAGLQLKPPESSCDYENGGCSHQCNEMPSGVKCNCPKDFLLLEDEKTCIELIDSFEANVFGKEINFAVMRKDSSLSEEIISMKRLGLLGACVGFLSVLVYFGARYKRQVKNRIAKVSF